MMNMTVGTKYEQKHHSIYIYCAMKFMGIENVHKYSQSKKRKKEKKNMSELHAMEYEIRRR